MILSFSSLGQLVLFFAFMSVCRSIRKWIALTIGLCKEYAKMKMHDFQCRGECVFAISESTPATSLSPAWTARLDCALGLRAILQSHSHVWLRLKGIVLIQNGILLLYFFGRCILYLFITRAEWISSFLWSVHGWRFMIFRLSERSYSHGVREESWRNLRT